MDEIKSRLSEWWRKAQVTVVGLSILVSVITGTWVTASKLTSTDEKVTRIEMVVQDLVNERKTTQSLVASLTERTGKLEGIEHVRAADWPDLKDRIKVLERYVLGSGRPSIGPGER